jgi:RNA polymerase sigma-70 factor (ECF subfamily)
METLNFNEIYIQYNNEVLEYIVHRVNNINIAIDICSDSFEKVLKYFNTYDSNKAKFNTWLYTIVNNNIIDYWRKNNRIKNNTKSIDNVNECYQIPDSKNDFDNVDNFRLNLKIKKAIGNLKPNYRSIAYIYFLKNMPYDKIAEIYNYPIGTVKNMINRIREMLQKELRYEYELIKN